MKKPTINVFHVLLGVAIIVLIFLSYFFVGEIDTSPSTLNEIHTITIPWIHVDIDLQNASLLFASVLIGLLDGFNPCAMWVLIYLISLATTIGDRKKMYVIVGTFVATETIMYFVILAGWLNVFMFIGISKWVLYIVGVFAIWTGAMSLKSFIQNGGQIVCEVGDATSRKKTMNKIEKIIHAPITVISLCAIILLAIVINSIEFICSSGLPAIYTQMLAVSHVSLLMKYVYIAIYDLFFMIDDFIIFALAIWAINTKWIAKYSGLSKLLGGLVMLAIGVVILFFPNWLF